jgi:uroporphyrinogen-III decarboxylase
LAYPGVVEDLRTCARRGIPSRVPVFALGEEFDVELYGVDYREYIWSAEKMVQCQLQAVESFDYDWILLHPDDYIEFEPLGLKTQGAERIPPAPAACLPATRETLQALRLPDPACDGRMPVHLAALGGIKSAHGDSLVVSGRCAAPFSATALLYGISDALLLLFDDPGLFRDTCEFFVELMSLWGAAQVAAGADAVWLGDCVASSGFCSPRQYEEFAVQPAQRVAEAIKQAGGTVIYHAGDHSLPHLRIGAEHFDIINLGEGIDMALAKAELGDRVCLSGNAHPLKLMNCRDLDEVAAETARIVEAGKPGGGYLFNTGEGIPRQVQPDVVRTMIQTAKAHGAYQ